MTAQPRAVMTAPAPTPNETVADRAQLGYRPAWVPIGYAEQIRQPAAPWRTSRSGRRWPHLEDLGRPGRPWAGGGGELLLYVRTEVTDLNQTVEKRAGGDLSVVVGSRTDAPRAGRR